MKANNKSRVLNFAATVFLTIAFSTVVEPTAVYAASYEPEVLITEIMPMSQTSDDSFEYIELYNNSDQIIDLKDYKLPFQNIDITTSKIISPKGILVVCTRGTTTLEDFNDFYDTSLTSDKYVTLPFVKEALRNDSSAGILLASDDGTVVSRAYYSSPDFQLRKSVTYKYAEGGFDMAKLAQKQIPTPGSINSNQVPQNGIRVTDVTLNKSFITMDVNQTAVLYATVAPATAANKSLVWTTNNSDVVEISQGGVLTSKEAGVAKITVTTVDGAFTDECDIVVAKIPVTGVTLDKSSASIEVGQEIVLAASVIPRNATNQSVTWKTSNSYMASVDSNGIVIGKTAGDVTITAETVDGKYKAVCKIKVDSTNAVVPVEGISLNENDIILNSGRVIILEVNTKPSNATNKEVTWKSSNSSVATVDDNGIVTTRKPGNVWITATSVDGGFKDYCYIRVTEESDSYVPVTGIELNTFIAQMVSGESEALSVSVLPAEASNKKINWSTNNSLVAAVDDNGKITALNRGIAIVTAESEEGKFEDRCIVIVWDSHSSWDSKDIFWLRLNKTSISIMEDKHEKLTLIAAPGNIKSTHLIWESSNEKVAYVSQDGRVFGISEGAAQITVKTADGKYYAQCEVTVTDDKGFRNGKGKAKGHWKKED